MDSGTSTPTTEAPTDEQTFGQDIKTIPNMLSLFRIVGIFVAALLASHGAFIPGLVLGVTAAFTDTADGYYARKLDQETPLGALLDSLADVLFSVVCLGFAVHHDLWPLYLLFVWAYRDLTLMTMRASAAQQGFSIPTIYMSKVGSTVNFLSFLIMAVDFSTGNVDGWKTINTYIHYLGLVGIHGGLTIYLVSGTQYLKSYIEQYRG